MKKISRFLRGAVAAVMCIFAAQLLTVLPAHALSGYSVMSLSNGERAAVGAGSLSYSYALANAAQSRAQDMIDSGYWSHTSPTGRSMGSFLSAAGYPIYAAGENLSRGYSDDSSVVAAWMASSGHRATILNSNYNEVGVGYATGSLMGEYTTIVVAYYAAQGPIQAPAPVIAEPEAPASQPVQAPEPVAPAPARHSTQQASETPSAAGEQQAEDQTQQPQPVPETTTPSPVHQESLADTHKKEDQKPQQTNEVSHFVLLFKYDYSLLPVFQY